MDQKKNIDIISYLKRLLTIEDGLQETQNTLEGIKFDIQNGKKRN